MTQHLHLRRTITVAIGLILCALATPSFAQGVFGGLNTTHTVDPGPGGPAVFIPFNTFAVQIDLDPNGPRWNKSISDPQNIVVGTMAVDIVERIQNVGTEPWGDWHEVLLSPPSGLPPSTWLNVFAFQVNGNAIGYTVTGLGTQTLNFFNFSQPVMPGDILDIYKQVLVDGSIDASGGPLIRMQEYPTPYGVPEPCALALSALACGGTLLKRRRAGREVSVL